ncbi:hypothetical protein SAY87_004156 [Trapa incisa]|uniref:PARP-type domain-containing protein n=1 Tax=Trapa incisa TaxID=236973 RepID=A0AAN7JNJ8_9MYRT|nr:hypothetical protein SAY87_004156 [Trapa incisa]
MRTTRSLIEPVWISSAIPSFLPLPSPSKGFVLFPARGSRFSSMAPPTKTVVEYAKSGRSSCKKCSSAITKDALRVGAMSRDARGFDMTKWHHLGCFSFISLESAEAISGFSSLKSADQEAIKKLVSTCEIIPKTVCHLFFLLCLYCGSSTLDRLPSFIFQALHYRMQLEAKEKIMEKRER